jgi:hypothetical protein
VGPTISPTARTVAPGLRRAHSDCGGRPPCPCTRLRPPFPPTISAAVHLCSPRHSPLPPLCLTPMGSRRCSFPKPPATASLMRLLPPRARSSSSHSSKCRQREGHRLIPCPSSTAVWISHSDHPPRPPSPP